MGAPNYFSFLLCCHADRADVYYCGLPVGQVVQGVFHLHHFRMPDGSRRPLTMRDLAAPCPFTTVEELQAHLQKLVAAMSIPRDASVAVNGGMA